MRPSAPAEQPAALSDNLEEVCAHFGRTAGLRDGYFVSLRLALEGALGIFGQDQCDAMAKHPLAGGPLKGMAALTRDAVKELAWSRALVMLRFMQVMAPHGGARQPWCLQRLARQEKQNDTLNFQCARTTSNPIDVKSKHCKRYKLIGPVSI